MNEQDLAGIYRLRRAIEPGLAARGAVPSSPADIAELSAMLSIFDSEVDVDREVLDLHQYFHLNIITPAALR